MGQVRSLSHLPSPPFYPHPPARLGRAVDYALEQRFTRCGDGDRKGPLQIGKLRPGDNLPKDPLGRDGVEAQVQTAWFQNTALSSAVLPHVHRNLSKPKCRDGAQRVGLIHLVLEDEDISFCFCLSIYIFFAVFTLLTSLSSNRFPVHELYTAITHSSGSLWTSSRISGPI